MKLKYQFEFMEMDDKIVAVPIGEGADDFHGVIKLNDSAAAIFELLTQDTTAEAVVDALAQKYDTPRAELTAFVTKYITELQAEGLLD